MIKKWKVNNFRSIGKEINLELKPLTIFCGPNSSGKSAVIKSILLLSQSLHSQWQEEPLKVNGKFVNLGSLEDILHHNIKDKPLDIGFTINTQDNLHITLDSSIETFHDPKDRIEGRLHGRVSFVEINIENKNSTHFILKISDKNNKFFPKDILIYKTAENLSSQIKQGLFNYDILKPNPSELTSDPITEKIIATSFASILPDQLLFQFYPEIRNATQEIRQLINILEFNGIDYRNTFYRDHEISKTTQELFGIIERRIPNNNDKRIEALRNIVIDIRDYPAKLTIQRIFEIIENHNKLLPIKNQESILGDLARRINGSIVELQKNSIQSTHSNRTISLEAKQFTSTYKEYIDLIRTILGHQVYYIGPLRDDPKFVYATPLYSNQIDIGVKGEYTAAMLEIYADQIIEYPEPITNQTNFTGQFNIRRGSLTTAVTAWLQHMGLIEQIEAQENAKIGYQIKIKPDGVKEDLDLTSIGVGVSQILPTIVMALLAPKESILIFEQPEVHLHPKVQSILGDFFLGIIDIGKQCLVETHSEHLINRVRRRIAESENTKILDQTRIYFVERKDSISEYNLVEPNEFGAILKWPIGFFDDLEEESSLILKAAIKKRKK